MVRKFYQSSPFTLTLEQIQWLENYNASEVIRCLLSIAMSSKNFDSFFKSIISIDKRILRVKEMGKLDKVEQMKKQRKEFIQRMFDLK